MAIEHMSKTQAPKAYEGMGRRLQESMPDEPPDTKYRRASTALLRLGSFIDLRAREFATNTHMPLGKRLLHATRPMEHVATRRAYRKLQEENVYFHFANTHAVHKLSTNIRKIIRAFKEHVSDDHESHEDYTGDGSFDRYRRRTAQVTRSPTASLYGVFSPNKVCPPDLYLCPGDEYGTGCVVDKRTCKLPPNAGVGVLLDYQFLQAEIWLDDFDETKLINVAGACWAGYETNPASNPYLIENIMVPGDYTYCLPLIQPVPFGRFKKMTFDFFTWLQYACEGASEPCTCPWYYTGLLTSGAYVYKSVPYVIVANFHDGFGAFWTLFTWLVTWNTFLAESWTAAWSPMKPVVTDWWLHLWDGMGQPGTDQQILFCAGLHFPALFVCLLFILLVVGSWYGMFWVLYAIAKDALEIIWGVPFLFYETFFNRSAHKQAIDADKLQDFFEERFGALERALFNRSSATTPMPEPEAKMDAGPEQV
jgi:hypothetical protein